MIRILKMLLEDLKRNNVKDMIHYNNTNIKAYICSLESAIAILENLGKENENE